MMRVELEDKNALAVAEQKLRDAVDRALERGAVETAREAKNRAPKVFGVLTDAIAHRRVAWNEYEVISPTAYAFAIEYGRKPGAMPPYRPLLEWVKAKRIAEPEQQDRVTHLIRMALAHRGSSPQPYMRPALEAMSDRVRRLVVQGMERA